MLEVVQTNAVSPITLDFDRNENCDQKEPVAMSVSVCDKISGHTIIRVQSHW